MNSMFIDTPMLITEQGLKALIEAKITEPVARPIEEGDLADIGGIAVLPIFGPILPRGDFFTNLFGITNTAYIKNEFERMVSDDSVKSIVLNIDSPGGAVAGISALADQIYNARGRKPITAYIGGSGASAAYWLASAADRIVIDPTGIAGSIGVALKASKDDDIRIVSTLSPKKNLDIESEPGKAAITKTLDDIAAVMIESIARNRGVAAEHVLENYGQGGVFVGKAALNAGLVDEIGSFNDLLIKEQRRIKMQTFDEWTADEQNKRFLAQYESKSKAVMENAVKEAQAAAKQQERAAIMAMAAEVFGAEKAAQLSAILDTGATAEMYAAFKASMPSVEAPKVDTEEEKKAAMLRIIQGVQTPVINPRAAQDQDLDFDAKVEAKIAGGADRIEAIRLVARENPELHQKYIAKSNQR